MKQSPAPEIRRPTSPSPRTVCLPHWRQSRPVALASAATRPSAPLCPFPGCRRCGAPVPGNAPRRRADRPRSLSLPRNNSSQRSKWGEAIGKRQMRHHWLAVITAAHQRHRRPECAEAGDVVVPVLHFALEDRADQRVEAGAGVERAHKTLDHGFIDAGAFDDVADDDQITAWVRRVARPRLSSP